MIQPKTPDVLDPIVYPESDGQPMAENTVQYDWITMIKGNLDVLFQNDPNVFVAGDLFWFPVKGIPDLRAAPDTMVVIGRAKGDRALYRQWEEGGIPPRVVFEIMSPSNSDAEMEDKRLFYQKYGVQEYYVYDPDANDLEVWIRSEENLDQPPNIQDWVSPSLKIRFELNDDTLTLYLPNGRRFETYVEIDRDRKEAIDQAKKATDTAQLEKQRADDEKQRAERLRAQLRALGIEPES